MVKQDHKPEPEDSEESLAKVGPKTHHHQHMAHGIDDIFNKKDQVAEAVKRTAENVPGTDKVAETAAKAADQVKNNGADAVVNAKDKVVEAKDATKDAVVKKTEDVKQETRKATDNEVIRTAGEKTKENWDKLDDDQKDVVKGVGAKVIDKIKENPQSTVNTTRDIANSPEVNIIGDIVGGDTKAKLKEVQGRLNETADSMQEVTSPLKKKHERPAAKEERKHVDHGKVSNKKPIAKKPGDNKKKVRGERSTMHKKARTDTKIKEP